MARVPSKHDRDPPLDFEGFLNNLQDWELSLKDKDKKLKSQPDMEKMEPSRLKNSFGNSSTLGVNGRSRETKEPGSGTSQKIGAVGVERRNTGKATSVSHPSMAGEENYLQKYDTVSQLSSSFMEDDSSVDASSEKELGNEFFKQRKYKEAVECYSRSLALSPTAVAYANRAMAYLKLKRFQEAEEDCTEALNLDDRYIKAYSRRSTARKELGKLKDAKEDADFALRLEPHNQEIKKQYTEAKSLYDKELLKKASASFKGPTQGEHNKSKLDNGTKSTPKISVTKSVTATKTESPEEFLKGSASLKGPTQGEHKELKLDNGTKSTPKISEMTSSTPTKTESPELSKNIGKKVAKDSVQQLAARAASLAAAEAAKNIVPPTSAYQFEASWRGFFGDPTLQARLLKVTNPVALPQIFKNALSASLLIDIIRCIGSFFNDETELAVKYLENLPKVSRFNTIIMCLSPADKSDLQRIWDGVFSNKEVAPDILQQLRPKYCC
ncbi:hypothetical protein SSX86_005347 [Deinandra increscens subsp. villosa]|uniref:RNA-polymerase II-associated protein 3-like C-terminal domain-containing protein n=1 Tax=Deinandra increscens subsp. villosa TaxID=3103831 RepID=A0AAP0DQS2_9ASTR